jgi:ribosome-associated protein
VNNIRSNPTLKLAKLCREAALDKKADDVVLLDMRGITAIADYFLICSGNSEPHLKAIADGITRRLRAEAGLRPSGRDGFPASRWVVLDYRDILIHIFHPEVRQRYALEQLWGDAKRVK